MKVTLSLHAAVLIRVIHLIRVIRGQGLAADGGIRATPG